MSESPRRRRGADGARGRRRTAPAIGGARGPQALRGRRRLAAGGADGVDLDVARGEAVAIIGESGSGKSTLLHVLGGLDRPTPGRSGWAALLNTLGEEELSHPAEHEAHRLRLPVPPPAARVHGAGERDDAAADRGRSAKREARERARELLSRGGAGARLEHKPGQLSGGEQQRVAVARALANQPLVLLADEPSGNLDPSTSERLHDLLFAVSEEQGTAMVLVTHNLGLAARAGSRAGGARRAAGTGRRLDEVAGVRSKHVSG
jgi:predicted ABC-type transport system involved in lysophospholipase L1 biosynthesis ATPase subunit